MPVRWRIHSSFVSTNATATVYAVALQTNGCVVIGGDFTNVLGTARNRFARLNADGSLDATFDPGPGADNTVYAITFLSDGTIVLGGDFTTVSGFARRGVVPA